MKKHFLLLLTVVYILNALYCSASQTSKSILFAVLDFQGEIHASELQTSVREKHFQTLLAPASFDRTQLVTFRADQIRHVLEQNNALNDKPANKSYYLVLDFQQLEKLEDANSSPIKGWKASVDGYLFRIDKNSNNRSLYRTAFPLIFVAKATLPVEVSRLVGKAGTSDQLLKELVQKSFDENLDSLQKALVHYIERTPISQVQPIRAKVGIRENIRVDDRFFVYDYVYNKKTFKTDRVFRGIVRATNKIFDNWKNPDSSGTTKFYQTYGTKLKPGFVLDPKMNSGYELSVLHANGAVNGWFGRLDLRMSRHIGIPALYFFLEAGMEKMVRANTYYMYGPYNLYRFEAGIAKGIQVYSNLELRPYVGLGEETNALGIYKGYYGAYYKLGVNLNVNILPYLQLFGGYGFSHFGNIRQKYDNRDFGVPWTNCFPNRNGGNTVLGLKIAF